MQKYSMTGELVAVGPLQKIGAKEFLKREIVLCEDKSAQYPKCLAWELKQDRTNLVNEGMIGKVVTVTGYPESRAYTSPRDGMTRYFTSLTAITVNALADVVGDPYEPSDDEIAAENEEMPF